MVSNLYILCIGKNQHDSKDVNCSAINGGWSEFENWQSCDETCHKKRGRSCTNPSPAYGGENCTGDDYETQFCTDKECKNHDCYEIGRYRGNDIILLPMENLNYSFEKCQEECQKLDNCVVFTGYSLSEALILPSINPKYGHDLF